MSRRPFRCVPPHAPLFLALAAFLAFSPGAHAQTPLGEALSALSLREIGPAIMGGRVADLAVVESRPSTFYVGFASGGVWRTDSDGAAWTPLFDHQPCASVGDVTVFQANPRVVWVGTGEPQNRQSSPYGCGVFRSTDGGATWTSLGLEDTRHIGRIALHPTDPDVAYVAALGHLFGPNEERGVFRTTDGGDTWERVLYVDENTGAIDIVMDPSDPNTLFAAMYQRRRTVFGFSASGPGSGLYRTTDGGETWTELTVGLPKGDKGRIGIDIYRRNPDIVYALVESRGQGRGLYRSEDRGETWTRMSARNPRPMYFSLVRVDPTDDSRVYLGGVQFSISDDGGRTWTEGNAAEGIHVDHHALWIDPSDPQHLILGNDGGVASSRDGGRSWRHHNNLAVGQFYEIGVDMSDPYRVCGGLQDNSSWCAPNRTLTPYGLRNRDWFDVWGGDGFYNQFDPHNPDVLYSESQGGNSGRVHLATGEVWTIRPLPPAAEGDEERRYRYNWNAPIVASRHHPGTVYVGNNHLMRSRDGGLSWEEASPDLTRAIDRDTLTIMGERVTARTLSRHDGTANYGTITAIEESPLSGDVLYVGTDDGNLQVTLDGGATWTNVAGNVPGLPDRSYVSRIEASYHEPGRVYATFDLHWDDDYRPYVFVSEDYGRSWRSISTGLPEWSVNVIREHPRAPRLLFVGNEVGVYVSTDGGASWHRLAALPTVPVDDLVVHERDNDLVIGTHGRSIWVLDDLSVLERASQEDVWSADAYLFPVAEATQWFRLGGWPFWGEEFEGDNPPDGAVIRVWRGEGAQEVRLRITTSTGQTVRELEVPEEPGLHEVVWDLREAAPVEVPDEDDGGGGGFFRASVRGPLVLPGTYMVELSAGTSSVQREVRVRLDPRVEPDLDALRARQEAARDAATIVGTITLAQRSLQRLTRQLADARRLLGEAGASEELRDAAQQLSASLDSLRNRIQEASPGRVVFGIERNAGPPTADQLRAIDEAWARVPSLVEELNGFITRRVPDLYRRMAEAGVHPDPGEPVPMPRRGR